MTEVLIPTYRDLMYPTLVAVQQLRGSAAIAELDEMVIDVAEVTEEQLAVEYPLRSIPTPTAAPLAGSELRASKDDALQLAHYRRMLQAQGRAAPTSLGGIIGKERVVV